VVAVSLLRAVAHLDVTAEQCRRAGEILGRLIETA
jgi:hypothetical protein